ncbi:MAG TPA: hypothetical protein VE075_07225 [Thermoanaerobaculia bacterium]|nr:hypothetical protein [Thermoanaerobaculia bacterium]
MEPSILEPSGPVPPAAAGDAAAGDPGQRPSADPAPPDARDAAGSPRARPGGAKGWLLGAGAVLLLAALFVVLRAAAAERLELVGVVERRNVELLAPVPWDGSSSACRRRAPSSASRWRRCCSSPPT